uniref:Secreted protein n=1 Tax=Knipowitschia caucasica TaxID=637954 RepID=A0AAV2M5J6_KNICA
MSALSALCGFLRLCGSAQADVRLSPWGHLQADKMDEPSFCPFSTRSQTSRPSDPQTSRPSNLQTLRPPDS